jgi:phosphatidate cytidylyltransferase
MHAKRIITGATGLLFIVLTMECGMIFIFSIFIAATSLIALYEYNTIAFNKSEFTPLPAISYPIALALIYGIYIKNMQLVLFIITFNLFISAFTSLFGYNKDNKLDNAVIKQVFGLIYIPLFLSFAILIRSADNGAAWIYLLLAVVFAGDTGAFYVGSYLGRDKLAPLASPNKTIEGSIAGLTSGICAGFLIRYLLLPDISWQRCLMFCIVIGITGQIGDLFESTLKRSAGVKDSGNILPGHGGVLDRIDALLFASPFAYFIIKFF